MAKTVDKRLYKNYLQKAEEMLDVAQYAVHGSKNNAAVAASVHCAINAVDALAVFYLGKRHVGGHEEAMNTIKGAVSEAEYQPDLMKEAQARDAVTRASRILSKAKQKLP